MKIEAGLKLNTRNPSTALPSAIGSAAACNCPFSKNVAARKLQVIKAIPPARPSMLSSKLMAFVIPTSQKIVKKSFSA